ncbi:MAG: hypothetical protein MI974_13270 [Chitinophagales bacterium]|nr:hypothetical protein [Chitinophagales bacterium]
MSEEKEIQEGFNAGYLIARYRPELMEQLGDSLKEVKSSFVEGFSKGGVQAMWEREADRSKGILKLKQFSKVEIIKPTKSRGKDQDKGIEK